MLQPSLAPPLERSLICNAVIGGHASGPRATRHEAGKKLLQSSVGVSLSSRAVLRKYKAIYVSQFVVYKVREVMISRRS
jgi:hypothetical protein